MGTGRRGTGEGRKGDVGRGKEMGEGERGVRDSEREKEEGERGKGMWEE